MSPNRLNWSFDLGQYMLVGLCDLIKMNIFYLVNWLYNKKNLKYNVLNITIHGHKNKLHKCGILQFTTFLLWFFLCGLAIMIHHMAFSIGHSFPFLLMVKVFQFIQKVAMFKWPLVWILDIVANSLNFMIIHETIDIIFILWSIVWSCGTLFNSKFILDTISCKIITSKQQLDMFI